MVTSPMVHASMRRPFVRPYSLAQIRGEADLDGDLDGITVLELSGLGPATRCVRVLADLGARWIRVVPPEHVTQIHPPWHSYGAYRGAMQLRLNLKSPGGPPALLRVASRVDVIIESFRPGVANRLGIGYDRVRAANERIVYCALTGYGQTGPYAPLAGHDLNYVARTGALHAAARRPDGGPFVPGLTMADSAGGGWQAAIRVLAALVARQQTGRGQYLDVSASEGMLQLMALTIDEHLATGVSPPPGGSLLTGGYACYDTYETADGRWVAVAAIEPRFFANLCTALEIPERAEHQFVAGAQVELREALACVFRTRTRADWMAVLAPLDACVTPVLTIEEVTTDPHWETLQAFATYEHPEHGVTRQVRPFGGGLSTDRGRAPLPGASDSEEVLRDAGFSPEEIGALRGKGVIE
jgi:alpha-methylacyl-CoA racemase